MATLTVVMSLDQPPQKLDSPIYPNPTFSGISVFGELFFLPGASTHESNFCANFPGRETGILFFAAGGPRMPESKTGRLVNQRYSGEGIRTHVFFYLLFAAGAPGRLSGRESTLFWARIHESGHESTLSWA